MNLHDGKIQNTIQDVAEYIELTRQQKYSNGKIECIDYIMDKDLGFNLGNAVKYITRYKAKHGDKFNNPMDLKKAIHYILIELAGATGEVDEVLTESSQEANIEPKMDPITKIVIESAEDRLERIQGNLTKNPYGITVTPEDDVETIEDPEPVLLKDDKLVLDGKVFDVDPLWSGDHLDSINPEAVIKDEDLDDTIPDIASKISYDNTFDKELLLEGLE